jgi:hypothetical protein
MMVWSVGTNWIHRCLAVSRPLTLSLVFGRGDNNDVFASFVLFEL